MKAPRGSTTGTQGRSLLEKYAIPDDLCDWIVHISEDYIHRLDVANEYLVSQWMETITPHWGEEPPNEAVQMELYMTGRIGGGAPDS